METERISYLFWPANKEWTANLKTIRLHSIVQTAGHH